MEEYIDDMKSVHACDRGGCLKDILRKYKMHFNLEMSLPCTIKEMKSLASWVATRATLSPMPKTIISLFQSLESGKKL